ncbi:hypothetical protein FGF1_40160 [Flavobacteriaceae bacterium GF1]
MRTSFLSILFLFVALVDVSAQIAVEGRVYFDQKPMPNVSVFLNNTTVGTTTNSDGEFKLHMPDGVYELVISHIGFKTIKYNLDTSTYTEPFFFQLSEEKLALDEVVVVGRQNDEEWNHNFAVFVKEFLGTSEFSTSCTILNPNVLFFEFDPEKNSLTAQAMETLRIKNEALGYEIRYDLEHFSIENKLTTYAGFAYFKELSGRKNKHRKWKKNRLRAYKGSQLHFYRSVRNHTAQEEGFVIHQFARKKNPKRPTEEELSKARKIVASSNVRVTISKKIGPPKNALDSAVLTLNKARLPKYVDYLYKADLVSSDIVQEMEAKTYLKFDDNLRITYLHEKEEEGYILRNPFSKPRKALPQTSNIIPLTDGILIYNEGILAEPLHVRYEEYWSYEKFAHALPLDYEPEY